MRILVTGGCGFIGSNFIKYIFEKNEGHRVLNLDKMTYAGKGKNLEHMGLDKNPNYLFVKGSVNNSGLIKELLEEYFIDAVVNFAAESHVDRSIEDASLFIKTNFDGVQVLLDAARKHKIEKFVQIGTDEVYGSLDENSPSSKEGDPINPRSPYSASKLSADVLALSYYYTHELPVCVTRSSNNYGAYQFPEKVIPLFITNLLKGKKVPLYGEGKNIREWIYVLDNCDAIFKVLENGKAGEIYNIGSGIEKTNFEMTKKILTEMGVGEEMIKPVEDRKAHDLRYSLNCEKIKRELNWKPKRNFDDGIKETIKWYKENEVWWGTKK